MLHTTTRRLGAAVAATALSSGALVAMAAPAANAATVDTTYTCVFPCLGVKDIPVSINATLPPTAPAGFDAPAIPVLLTVTLPGESSTRPRACSRPRPSVASPTTWSPR